MLNDLPYQVQPYFEVAVDHGISHAGDFLPGNGGMGGPQLGAHVSRRLADDLDVAYHRVLCQSVGEESVASVARIFENTAAGITNVHEAGVVSTHRSTASARI